jgi:hypothetical protein
MFEGDFSDILYTRFKMSTLIGMGAIFERMHAKENFNPHTVCLC